MGEAMRHGYPGSFEREDENGVARRDSGFTLLETTIAIAVITLGLVALLAVLPHMISLSRISREVQVGVSAARSKIEEMRAMPFPSAGSPNILDTYTGAGATFTAVGLVPPPDGVHGRIAFLTEAQAAAEYGITLDLDLDRTNNETEAAQSTFVSFPVRVSVSWLDEANQVRGVTLTTIVYNLNK